METKPQSFANHVKWDPKWHFILIPVLLLNVLYRVYEMLDTEVNLSAIWEIVIAAALFLLLLTVRWYSLRVQDRVIRLEERLRMAELLPPALRSRAEAELAPSQLLGLRFASDAELPGLVEEALRTGMGTKQIKLAVKSWRPDHFRV